MDAKVDRVQGSDNKWKVEDIFVGDTGLMLASSRSRQNTEILLEKQ